MGASMLICKICNTDNKSNNNIYYPKELMLGLREEFKYFVCENCDCLQIAEVPKNLSDYYPKNYYSYNKTKVHKNIFLQKIKKLRLEGLLGENSGIISKIINKIYPPRKHIFSWLKLASIKCSDHILDVGCGSGEAILKLYFEGFSSEGLLGVDPFIDKDLEYDCGVKVVKGELDSIKRKFDFIMFHHSFEHITNPLETLKMAHAILNPGKKLLIRIPVASGFVFEKYRENWVQLDAPRHIFLHTHKSMEYLAKLAGFEIDEVIYDSDRFQFVGSELYQSGGTLDQINDFEKSKLSADQLKGFDELSKKLNLEKKGDAAGFILKKI